MAENTKVILMSVIIGADIVPSKHSCQLFENGKIHELLGEVLYDRLRQADIRIFNLETPLADREKPIKKHGPHLLASTSCANAMKAMGIDLFTLANNHIMDHDVQGLRSTIHVLDDAGINHVGAGENIHEAQKPFFFSVKGKKCGVYACAEHEFSIAGENRPGANPFDPLDSLDHISKMKTECDYAIVLYHGGKEFYRYPSPHLQKVCRKLVEKGADLVICQHSHCIGCKEDYMGGIIIYGQGNFMFDGGNDEFWNTSMLVYLNDNFELDYIPLEKTKKGVRVAEGKVAENILESFAKRSQEIKQPGMVERLYKDFSEQNETSYILYFSGKSDNFVFRVLNRLTKHKAQEIFARIYKKRMGTGVRNYIECEAHRELILKALE